MDQKNFSMGDLTTIEQQITPSSCEVVIKVDMVSLAGEDYFIYTNTNTNSSSNDNSIALDTDIAGIVICIGDSVYTFSIGDRVVAFAQQTSLKNYIAANKRFTSKVPPTVTLEDAVVLPSPFTKAYYCLFSDTELGLPLTPRNYTYGRLDGAQSVLIWDAASAAGYCAVQLCIAAKYDVTAVINVNECHQYELEYTKMVLQTLGAGSVLNSNSIGIMETMKIKQIRKIFIASGDSSSAQQCHAAISECFDNNNVKLKNIADIDWKSALKNSRMRYLMGKYMGLILYKFMNDESFIPAIIPEVVAIGNSVDYIDGGFEKIKRVLVHMVCK